MDMTLYALLNKKIKGLVSGVRSAVVRGTTIVFTMNDGSTQTMTFPTPADGQDGFSPIVDVRRNDANDGAIISITDKDGLNEFEIKDGKDGLDGFSPTIEENVGNTADDYRLDITDKNGTITTPNLIVKGADGQGVPAGGDTGQILVKKSEADFDTEWQTPQAGTVIVTDTTPTPGSQNPVQSGGVFDALELKQDKLVGNDGQLVGFDAQGNAIAVDAPETGVTEFNGRKGVVVPEVGDYTADMVGADPVGSAAQALIDANTYTDEKIAEVNADLELHIQDTDIHITTDERDTWNKVSDEAVRYDNSRNVHFEKLVVLDTNQKLLGRTPDDNDNHVLVGTLAWNIGTPDEYIQNEFGSAHVHMNLNSKDRPTVELPGGVKHEVAYLDETVPQIEFENHTQDTDIHITADERITWNEKQDLLTGNKGQYVGFDDDGKAVAVDLELDKQPYVIEALPDGCFADYREKEIRVFCPVGAQFVQQQVGAGGDANKYYITVKAYAPNDTVVKFKEDLKNPIEDQTIHEFGGTTTANGVDPDGRKYSTFWLPVAEFDGVNWTYYGANSTTDKYLGWYYSVEWYDANNLMVGSDVIRINLTNENCHTNIKPFYANELGSKCELNEISKADYALIPEPERKDKVYYIFDDDEDDGDCLVYSDTRPTTVDAQMGDIVFNSLPEPNGYVGWVFTAFGWLGFGVIEGTKVVEYILNDMTTFMVDDGTGTGNGTPFLYRDTIG